MKEILEQHFPAEVAQLITKYQSHPTADIMRDFINKSKPYGVQELLNSKKRERLRREMEEEDRRAWQNHYWRYSHIYRYI